MHKAIKRGFIFLFQDSFILRAYQRNDIEQQLAAPGSICLLDVGAGDLGLTCWLKRRNPNWTVVACDLLFSDEARRLAAAADVRLSVTNGNTLPPNPGGYDRILLSSVLQMVPNPAGLLLCCAAALRPDSGRLVLTVPAEYHFIDKLCRSRNWVAKVVRRVCRVPDNLPGLSAELKRRFGVLGPQGCYSQNEIMSILRKTGFVAVSMARTPGWCGTLAWECSLLLSLRWGPKMFAVMGLLYPVVWVGDRLLSSRQTGEHLVSASLDSGSAGLHRDPPS
jgi:SAM-dependent methyltransferase